jgi:hypothetical protein
MFNWLRKAFSYPKTQLETRLDEVREFKPAKLPPRRVPQSEDVKLMKLRMECDGRRSNEEYDAEFRRLVSVLFDKFAIGATPRDLLLESMNAVENEMNRNGGGNWNTGGYDEHLNCIREQLTADSQFTAIQVQQINWSVSEIAACGRELEERGASSRPIQREINYLVARVVDCCETHPPPPTQQGPTMRY